MLHGGEVLEVVIDDAVAVEQTVAAGNQDIVELSVLADIVGHLVELSHDLIFRKAHEALAEAVAAVHGAEIGGKQKGSLRIFVLQAAHFGIALFARGVKAAFGGDHFHAAGHSHFADGIVRVVGIDEGEVVTGYAHGITLDDGADTLLFLFVQRQVLCQLGGGGDITGKLFLPSHKNSSFIANECQLAI